MLEAGTVLQDRYLIERQIGQGGMGTVYIATDQRFGSKVAIKETIFTDPGLQRAFEREAHLLNNMRHPALPRVSDYFAEGDGQFLVMEYIAGEDLSEMLKRDVKFRVSDVLNWADQLLDALDYLHSQRNPVIHRDIKPQNLKLAPRGQIILLDFGLAKGNSSDVSQLSQTKSVFGYSRAYAPLEQIQGTGTDVRSDLYSLAATIYHMLTGSSPIDALTRATAVLNSSDDPLQPVNELNPKVPAEIAEVLQQAMSLNSSVRPDSAAAMRDAVLKAASHLEPDESEQSDYHVVAAQSEMPQAKVTAPGLLAPNSTVAAQTTAADSVKAFAEDPEATKFTDAPAANQNVRQAAAIDSAKIPAEPIASLQIPIQPVQPAKTGEQPVVFVPPPVSHRRSIANPLGVAAAILILGGGGLAAWYATSGASNPDPKTAPTTQTQTTRKLEGNEVKPAANTSSSLTNTAAGSETQTFTKDQPTNGKAASDSSTQTDAQTNNRGFVVEKVERPESLPARSKPEENPEEQTGETEETGQETEAEAPKPGDQDLPEAPPPPSDREAVRRYQQKQKAAERQRINEENRKRREQGQQELELPPAPRPNEP